MTLLVDANVLIDLWYVGGLWILPKLARTEVLDIVLAECLEDRNPGIRQQVLNAGITEVESNRDWWEAAKQLKNSRLSARDVFNLYYAIIFGRVLLTNEWPLRKKCRQFGVSVHGTLWVIQQAYEMRLVDVRDLCKWLHVLPETGSRLPEDELMRLRQALGCGYYMVV